MRTHFTEFKLRFVTNGRVSTKHTIYKNLTTLESICTTPCAWAADLKYSVNMLQAQHPKAVNALHTLRATFYNETTFAHATVGATSLRNLTMTNCLTTPNFDAIAQSPFLSTLETLRAEDCFYVVDLTLIASMRNLTSLALTGCHKIHSFKQLFGLTQLEHLTIKSARLLEGIPGFDAFINLKTLSLHDMTPDELNDISIMTSLTSLTISNCGTNFDMPDLGALTSLTSLAWTNSIIPSGLAFLRKCTLLTSLTLSSYILVRSINHLSTLTSLTNLELDFRTETPLSCLTTLGALRHLGTHIHPITYPRHNTALTSFSNLVSLKIKDNTPGHLPLTTIQTPSTLTSLSISKWTSFTSHGWDDFMTLQTLVFTDCPTITSLHPLAVLDELETLVLRRCESLVDLGGFEAQYSLTKLEVLDCKGLVSARGCQDMQILTHLSLRGCTYVTHLGHTLTTKPLRFLDITNCDRLLVCVHDLRKPNLTVVGDNRIESDE